MNACKLSTVHIEPSAEASVVSVVKMICHALQCVDIGNRKKLYILTICKARK